MSDPGGRPDISVCIVTGRRLAMLDAVLADLAAQEGAPPYELLVCSDGDAGVRATVLRQAERRNRAVKQPIQRYKGLGEMDADQLAETTMDPQHRTLRKVTMADAEQSERIFELLMGNEVAPRRDFIVRGSARLDRERIDA